MDTLYIGIDWSEDKHDVCILNQAGAILKEFTIGQTPKGQASLDQEIASFGLAADHCLVGLETANNLVMDFLESRPYTAYVIAPNQVASSRGRFSSSGRRNDRSDAHLLADMLRTDRHRFAPWQADGVKVNQMKASLRLIDDLTQSITRYSNRLRASLLRAYPLALGLFNDLTTQIGLQFLIDYPLQTTAQQLTYADFAAFCRQHHYSQPQMMPKRYAHLQRDVPQPAATTALAFATQIPVLATLLLSLVQQKRQAIRRVQELFGNHPDQHIFTSVPGAGELLAPKLLVMFGDHRQRFPMPMAIQTLAGTCPVTIQSGKKKIVKFRRACNHEYRHTAQLLAIASTQQSTWAASYFGQAKARGLDDSHAYRCLANRWLAIIWTLWQREQPYDETYHLQQVRRHRRA
jgi:transposase